MWSLQLVTRQTYKLILGRTSLLPLLPQQIIIHYKFPNLLTFLPHIDTLVLPLLINTFIGFKGFNIIIMFPHTIHYTLRSVTH